MNKILYVGSGEDLSPLSKFPNSKFIYIDSNPRNSYGNPYYYKPMYHEHFKEKIMCKLRENRIIQISPPTIFTDDFKEISVPDLDSHMVDFGRLKYYFSTSIPHEDYTVFKEKIIPSIIDDNIIPDTIFICGYHPGEDSLEILQKPFHFIGSYPTYFPKDIEELKELEHWSNKTCMSDIISNINNQVSTYSYLDPKGDLYTSSNYQDFYRDYKTYHIDEVDVSEGESEGCDRSESEGSNED